MINPHTRFTFFHATVSPAGTVVNQPIGWRDASLSLVRDPKGHSLVEFFKSTFVWYGAARTFINAVKAVDGPDAILRVLIEFKSNRDWETIHDGLIDISQEENLSISGQFYKKSAPIIRNDFWATFINRRGNKVDLQAAVDLDGNARTAVNKITLPLPSQKIVKEYYAKTFQYDDPTRHEESMLYEFVSGTANLGVINLPIITKKTLTELREGSQNTFALYVDDYRDQLAKVIAEDDGEVTIDFSIVLANNPFGVPYGGSTKPATNNIVKLKVGGVAYGVTQTNYGSAGVDGRSVYTYSDTHTIKKGQFIELYMSCGTEDVYICFSGLYEDTYISMSSVTTYVDTTTDAYLIKDAFESVLSKIIGQDAVVSSTMFTTCKRLNAIFKGVHGRGYAFSEKPFTTSFDELWNGFEPIANCGFGYTEVAGVKKITLEEKTFYYGKVPSVFISNPTGLTSKYDNDKLFKKIEVGYGKRFVEAVGGIDDPQTLANWQTRFRTIGTDFKIISSFFLASLGIEQNRRNVKEKSKDGKIDEDIIMVSVVEDGSDYTPELGTDFNAVTNLSNSDTRYNIRHSCARLFKRWQSFIQGCLQHTTGESFKYAGGEGNRTMTSQFETTDCESTDDPEPVLAEDDDIAVTTDHLFIPEIYKCKAPMAKATYDAILADKENAIGILVEGGIYLPMHILDLDYKLFGGYADLTLLLASNTPVSPSEGILMEDGNFILQEDGTNILMED